MAYQPFRRHDRAVAWGAHVVDELLAAGVELPDDVRAARAHVAAVEVVRTSDDPTVLRSEAAKVLADDPTADIADLARRAATAEWCKDAAGEALDLARYRLNGTCMAHGDELVAAIRAALFDAAAATLEAAAALGPDATPAAALRAGNVDGARALADAPAAVETLAQARRLRARVYHGSGIDDLAGRAWRHPDRVKSNNEDPVDYWLGGIRAGGELWFGTFAEVEDRARQIVEARKVAVTSGRRNARAGAGV